MSFNVQASQSPLVGVPGMQLRRAHFDVIDSTQTRWREIAEEKVTNPALAFNSLFSQTVVDDSSLYVISAGNQTASFGTHGRVFHSVPDNVLATFALTWPQNSRKLTNISSIVALSCCETLAHFGLKPKLKWPNDLQLDSKKTGGILCETRLHFPTNTSLVLIGIGLNVNMDAATAQDRFDKTEDPLKIPFTSMLVNAGHAFDLEEVYTVLIDRLAINLFALRDNNATFATHFRSKIGAYLAYQGEEVTHEDYAGKITVGRFEGITDDGFANLLLATGEVITVLEGRIRPIPI